jgi:type II secretory pathway predicted ATPase ExeA
MPTPRRHPSTRPFMAAPRTQFFHPAAAIDTGLRSVERAIRRAEGVALVVGPPGTGKSLLLAAVAEHVRDDFDVAFLSGARICTRRALWQSILAEIGESYRGIDEVELRMAVVERIRGLAATGSGLVILVDEAHTLPTRLIEELRLLTNIPTPLPAVHIVLAGSSRLEELLGLPRMESMAQRVAARAYLDPLDHAETMAYLRCQMKTAGLVWEEAFASGSDDAVFTATDGVPRLVNQLCDHALVRAGDAGGPVTPADIAAAWREIQRLPAPAALERAGDRAAGITRFHAGEEAPPARHDDAFDDDLAAAAVIEFGGLEDDALPAATADAERATAAQEDPWRGPEVELVFGAVDDPFEELFAEEERVVERYVVRGPDDFADCPHVSSREGQALARLLEAFEREPARTASPQSAEPVQRHTAGGATAVPAPLCVSGDTGAEAAVALTAEDDADMVVIEEDLDEPPARAAVLAVRPGDYRSLFTRLRRGERHK